MDNKRVMEKGWRYVSIGTVAAWLMRALLALLLPYEIYRGDYLFAAATAIAIAISLVPAVVERNHRMHLPFEFDFLITLALFLHTFLGEGFMFYEKVYAWDKALHLYGTAVISLLAFMIVYSLHYTRKLRLTIPLIGFFTVTFALAVGAMWELCEFAVDLLFDKNTQKGLDDTMWDIFYDLVGGTVVAAFGMVYVRYTAPETRKKLTKPLGEIFAVLATRIEKDGGRR